MPCKMFDLKNKIASAFTSTESIPLKLVIRKPSIVFEEPATIEMRKRQEKSGVRTSEAEQRYDRAFVFNVKGLCIKYELI